MGDINLLTKARMLVLIVTVLGLLSSVESKINGPPVCTLQPRHSGADPQDTDWKDHFRIIFTKINENLILDPRNKSGTVFSEPNGWLVIIEPKELAGKAVKPTIKGFSMMATKGKEDGVYFPMISRNKKLKQLECERGETFLSHRDASEKKSISFFFKGHLDYMKKGLKRFKATILDSYSIYWMGV